MALCGILRQNTAVDILLGPCIDDTDGKTAETGLTLDVEVSKNGQALANKSDATAPVHDAAGTVDGYYNCELDTTDTNTIGILTVVAHAAGFLPVRQDYQIVDEVAYDCLFEAGATDYLPVDVTQIAAAAVNVASAQLGVNVVNIGGTAQTANDNGADINDILVDTAVIGALGAGLTGIPWNAAWDAEVQSECTDALNAYDPPTRAEATTDANAVIAAVDANEAKIDIIDTNVDSVLADTGTDGVVVAAASKTGYALADTTSDAVIADAVWNAATASYGGAGSYGLLVETDIDAKISDVPTVAEIQAELEENGASLLDSINDRLPSDPADESLIEAAITAAAGNVSVDEIQASALADLFNTDSGTTYAAAVSGSPVKEIADNAGGSALTEAGIADAVWNEAQSGHTTPDTFGDYLDTEVSGVGGGSAPTAAQVADAVWEEAQADHVTAGTTGESLDQSGKKHIRLP